MTLVELAYISVRFVTHSENNHSLVYDKIQSTTVGGKKAAAWD